jgi:diacylglycerol kinase family enzyme
LKTPFIVVTGAPAPAPDIATRLQPGPVPPMRQRFLLLRNPRAGLAGSRLADDVVAALGRRGGRVAEAPLAGFDAVAAVAGACDAVVAAGGDGTLRSLAPLLTGSRLPLGLVPAGTGNVLAREIGLPRDPDSIAATLSEGPAIDIGLGQANGAPFLLMAGVGFDGAVVARLDHDLKQRIGKLAYAGPMLRAWLGPRPSFTARIDGAAVPASWLIATRVSFYGGGFRLAAKGDLRGERLTAIIVRPSAPPARLAQLLALALGALDRLPGVEVRSCRRIVIEAPAGIPVQLDGDPFGATPVTLSGDGGRLRLIVPDTFARTH